MTSDPVSPIQQACAVAYRRRKKQLEFCLITSAGKNRWGFPKGIIDAGDTPQETARKEAWEEAGLRGHVVGEPLGGYAYHKWGTELIVTAYLMEVTQADDDWEEASWRDRVWCSPEETREWLHRSEQCDLLDVALERIESEGR